MNTITEYFSGERLQCLIGIVISSISIAFALYFLLQVKTEFYKGIAWPFIIISLLLLSICIGVVWRTPHDIERVTNYTIYEKEKVSLEEIPRMQGVLQNFKIIKVVELSLLLIGIGIVLFASAKGNSLLKGIGLGLVIQSAIMFGFDYFAHERGKVYFEFLQNL